MLNVPAKKKIPALAGGIAFPAWPGRALGVPKGGLESVAGEKTED